MIKIIEGHIPSLGDASGSFTAMVDGWLTIREQDTEVKIMSEDIVQRIKVISSSGVITDISGDSPEYLPLKRGCRLLIETKHGARGPIRYRQKYED